MAAEQQADAQSWTPLRPRGDPDSGNRRPDHRGRELSGRQEQHPAESRLRVRSRRPGTAGDPRRLRALLREDPLRVDRRPVHRHAVHELVYPRVPADRCRPRPAAGAEADRSAARERSGSESGAGGRDVPARIAAAQHRRELGRSRSAGPPHRPVQHRVSASARGAAVGQRRLRARGRPRHADVAAAESDAARDDRRHLAQHPPEQRHPGRGDRGAAAEVRPQLHAVHGRGHDAAQHRRDRLRRADDAAGQAVQQQLQRARVVHAGEVARQHQRRRHRGAAASRCSTTCTSS